MNPRLEGDSMPFLGISCLPEGDSRFFAVCSEVGFLSCSPFVSLWISLWPNSPKQSQHESEGEQEQSREDSHLEAGNEQRASASSPDHRRADARAADSSRFVQ